MRKSRKVTFKIPETVKRETRDFMRDVIKELNEKGGLTPAMRGALFVLMHQYNAYVMATEEVAEVGRITMVNDKGIEVTRPSYNAMMKSAAAILGYLKDFGLTTKSRGTLRPIETDDADPLAELARAFDE